MTASALVAVAVRPPLGAPRRSSAPERNSRLWQIAPALRALAVLYPEVSDQVIRQQAIEVLCMAEGSRASAAMVARLVEARVLALM